MIPRRITSNMGNPKFGLRGGQRLKLRQKWDGCPLRFWPLEQRDGTVNSFHATCTRCLKQKKKKNFKAFPCYFQMAASDRSLIFFATKQANQRS